MARSRTRSWPRLTLRGWGLLVVGAIAITVALVLQRRDVLFVGSVLVALPAAAFLVMAVRPLRMQVSRTFSPHSVPVGEKTVVGLVVRNLGRRALPVSTWRDVSDDGLLTPDDEVLPALDAHREGAVGRDSATIRYPLVPGRRGNHEVGPLLITQRDPFGLAQTARFAGRRHGLIVTPRITPLTERNLGASSSDGSLHELLRHSNPNADELIAREYRAGDPLRRVHWRATARRGELMVRQEEQRSKPEARVILDTRRSADELDGLTGGQDAASRDSAFELAVELTASIAVHLLRNGFRVDLVETGGRRVDGARSSRFESGDGEQALVLKLAEVSPVSGDDDAADFGMGSIGGPLGQSVPGFAVVVDLDPAVARRLAALRSQCEPAVAFVLPTARREGLELLDEAGWTCVRLSRGRDIRAAWELAVGGGVDARR
ncbi:DUF58 domain-containing protein [Compostimonas suwonensis]|uniref:Uncharacterized protein (DUF58 family) n=1 Tax=Compostimonas suwonensis TaxID=1048394 RepID=A0A2M9C003_9MICO|nr:DUF58 domain-containing protein [Compostimonas suwonensis]PJJ63658.1 uncharacterized protein (DUF58 family) [Compostimonas suwonensis]